MTGQMNGEELRAKASVKLIRTPDRDEKSGLVFSFKWRRSSRFPGAQITSRSRWFSRWLMAFPPQRPSGARVTEICFIKLPADRSVWISSRGGFMWIGLVSSRQ